MLMVLKCEMTKNNFSQAIRCTTQSCRKVYIKLQSLQLNIMCSRVLCIQQIKLSLCIAVHSISQFKYDYISKYL